MQSPFLKRLVQVGVKRRLRAWQTGSRLWLRTSVPTLQLPPVLGGDQSPGGSGGEKRPGLSPNPSEGSSSSNNNSDQGQKKRRWPLWRRLIAYGLGFMACEYIFQESQWEYYTWESKSAMLGVSSQLPRLFRGLRVPGTPPAQVTSRAGLVMEPFSELQKLVSDPRQAEQEPIFDNLEENPAPNSRRRVVAFQHGGRQYAIRVWETGPLSGPVVVVNAGTITMAAPLMRALGKTVRVVAYEHAGLGPDAGPLLAADFRDAAGVKPSERFSATQRAANSFLRSFRSKNMVDPMLVETELTKGHRSMVEAVKELQNEIQNIEVVTDRAPGKGQSKGSDGPTDAADPLPIEKGQEATAQVIQKLIQLGALLRDDKSLQQKLFSELHSGVEAYTTPGTEEECAAARKDFESMQPFAGVDELNEASDPSGILRRLRASQAQRLKKEHLWMYGGMDPTEGYAAPHSRQQHVLQNALLDMSQVSCKRMALNVRRPVPTPYAPFTGVRLPYAPTPELESKELTAVLRSTVQSDEPVILVGSHMNWLSTLHFSSRNAGAISGVVLVDPMLPFNHFPVNSKGIVTARNVSMSESGPIIATQQGVGARLPRQLRVCNFQHALLEPTLRGMKDALGRDPYEATGVRDPLVYHSLANSIFDVAKMWTVDADSGAQYPISGGYHTQWLLEKLGMLPNDRPYEDNTTMSLPARARPIEVTANHLWLDRLVRDAAFAHNPALRQFSIDSLIGDARSGPALYEAGKTGVKESQRAASCSRRAEYILQQQECLRVKNYLVCLYSAASEASYQEWKVAQMNADDRARGTMASRHQIRERTRAISRDMDPTANQRGKGERQGSHLSLRSLDFDDVNSPVYPARGFLKAMRDTQPLTRALGPHGRVVPLPTVERRYIMQLSADARRLAREALKRAGCITVDQDGTTFATKQCPSRPKAMQEAQQHLRDVMPDEQQLAELTMFDLSPDVPWRAHNHDSVAMSGLHRVIRGLLSPARLSCPVEVLVTQPSADVLRETPGVLKAKLADGLPQGKFLVDSTSGTRYAQKQVWDRAAGPIKTVGNPSGRIANPIDMDKLNLMLGTFLSDPISEKERSLRKQHGDTLRDTVLPKLSPESRKVVEQLLPLDGESWHKLSVCSAAASTLRWTPFSPVVGTDKMDHIFFLLGKGSPSLESLKLQTEAMVDSDDLGLEIVKTPVSPKDAARIQVLRHILWSKQMESSQEWESLLRPSMERQSAFPVGCLTPHKRMEVGEARDCPTSMGKVRVPAGAIAVPEWGYTGRGISTQTMQFGGPKPVLGRIVPDVGGGELEPDWSAVSKHIGQMVAYLREAEMEQWKMKRKARARATSPQHEEAEGRQ